MTVTRLDLDGTGSPFGLVTKILKAEPNLQIPVPIEELAQQLDISEIGELETDGFEGGLLTDEVRSFGGILIKKGANRKRRRFTIAHELGHFLIPFHKPVKAGEFLCSRDDMRKWNLSEQNRATKMEVEANQFAALILMPPPHLRPFIENSKDPAIVNILRLHEEFDVSKEAAARAYAEYHGEKVAVLVTRHNKLLRAYKRSSFPRLNIRNGQNIPEHIKDLPTSRLRQVGAEYWLETENRKVLPRLFEEVLSQKNGFALIMLWVEIFENDEFDPDENRTSKQRLQERLHRTQFR
ncbi:ImmA/IrrE family metallo-endopeptidase [Leptolyngbya cf. ectocarpi LEGE 11479]|uniref:ImmA/IrrE family metallo-endopeptidase n=1 Tax=Leptolyngbya cf. ectocarpi LEGE 11479 TaxID=1828722 RepID=A0A929FBQ1_LEPEC|nr:ImmA/IrrE family metallo-endopeptidase [Leptolyngbya ectocarpi]MBE9069337.1 ImmA/IrrE family metallo-endopeptidase [Leptolyngbya cf. ectocarpi LEGE 11479]